MNFLKLTALIGVLFVANTSQSVMQGYIVNATGHAIKVIFDEVGGISQPERERQELHAMKYRQPIHFNASYRTIEVGPNADRMIDEDILGGTYTLQVFSGNTMIALIENPTRFAYTTNVVVHEPSEGQFTATVKERGIPPFEGLREKGLAMLRQEFTKSAK